MLKALADRLAEAFAERLHEEVSGPRFRGGGDSPSPPPGDSAPWEITGPHPGPAPGAAPAHHPLGIPAARPRSGVPRRRPARRGPPVGLSAGRGPGGGGDIDSVFVGLLSV